MYSVIMAGGSGTRFWPASRKNRPKQLLALTGKRSLLQQTVERVNPLTPAEKVLVVTGQTHVQAVREQLPQMANDRILAEPMGRNTAAAAGLAAAWVARLNPESVCLVLPADHLITDEALFIDTLARAAQAAREDDVLVTLGLTPRYAATGFGYIETGEIVDQRTPQVCRVQSFREKPEPKTAQTYLDSGRYLWNSGMFAWRAEVLLQEIASYLPDLAQGLTELAPSLGTSHQDEALARIYPGLPSISIDYGVLEKSQHLRVVRSDFGWSDVGSWDALGDIWPRDESGNACSRGRILALEARDNVVDAGERLTALLGVNGLAVVVTDDVLLVLPKNRSQEVKRITSSLHDLNLKKYL